MATGGQGAAGGQVTTAARAAALGGIALASCYAYAPDSACKNMQRLRATVKSGDMRALLEEALKSDAAEPPSARLLRFFPAAALLVPVPGSAPGGSPRTTPAGRLAIALLQEGLGRSVWFGLRRVKAVRKSATAPPGARPSVRAHYDTMAIDAFECPAATPVILVDDVVSKGRTLLASALRVRDLMPSADVRAFALLRTVAFGPLADRLLIPCIGKIVWRREDARRTP